uniref:NAD(P)(+)--arginine ADP-ribosyltransferase n=2 Tax=Amphiprion percula TaxID=161767 RepID=A0A3P8TAG1_AMPPE
MESTAKKRRCSFNKDWETTYHWEKPVQGDSQRVFCEVCQSSFSVSHGGEYDVKRHSTWETPLSALPVEEEEEEDEDEEERLTMWNRRKLCLIAIIFTAVCFKGTAGEANLLDTRHAHVVDDLYNGCREKAMETYIHSGLLKQELNNSKGFQKAWSANAECSALIAGGIKEHTAALSVYYHADPVFLDTFDEAVETMGINASIYENDFHFKALHFLLMDSMALLKQKECKIAYRVTENKVKPAKGSTVRFGSFVSVNSNYDWLMHNEDIEGMVLYNITTCFFVNPGDHVCSKDKEELLLSPAEVFTVEEVAKRMNGDEEYIEVILKHSTLNSTHNCFSFSRSAAVVSPQWLVSVLAALLFFL